jgi:hypothetical protein
MMHRERYQIAPQLEAYYQIPTVLAPYLTLIQQPNYRSEIINTDASGFRFSYHGTERINDQSWRNAEKRGIILGGSFVFGVGATDDQHTIVSALNAASGISFLNLGIRAGNSTQELISTIPFLANADYVLVCSGVNNLVVSVQSTGENDVYGPLFSEGLLTKLAQYPDSELLKRLSLQDVGTTFLLNLLRKRIQNVLFGKLDGQKLGQRANFKHGDSERDLDAVCEAAVDRTQRDLTLLAGACAGKSKLIFALQPFASVMPKKLSSEERQLFAITDKMQYQHWQMLKDELVRLWPTYASRLTEICAELDVPILDLSQAAYDGWVFVDRVHMNDAGYFQSAQHVAKELLI